MNQVERLRYAWMMVGAILFNTILFVPTLPAQEREKQIWVRFPAYTHAGCEVDGQRLLPGYPDKGVVATYWLPRQRKQCLERINNGIAGCEMATSFLSWNQNQEYPGCLEIFAREVGPCQAHYESQRAACGPARDAQLEKERERLALEEERERLALEEERQGLEEDRQRQLELEHQRRFQEARRRLAEQQRERERQLEAARQRRVQEARRRLAEQQREREWQLEVARQRRLEEKRQEEANRETMEAIVNTTIGVIGGVIQQRNQRRRDKERAPTPTYTQPTFTPLPSPGSGQPGYTPPAGTYRDDTACPGGC